MPKLKKRMSKDFTTINRPPRKLNFFIKIDDDTKFKDRIFAHICKAKNQFLRKSNNAMIRDQNLGGMERGVLLTMLSLPDNWNFSIRGLTCILPDGYTKISTALKKLEKAGYLVRERIYCDGKISDWEYTFSDEPMVSPAVENVDNATSSCVQESGFQESENLETENLIQENQGLENRPNNKIKKNQESNNQENIDQESIDQSAAADGQIDGYIQEKEIYTEVVKSNIEYDDHVLWAEDSDGYMTVEELDEIVQMIVRAICSRRKTERICGQEFPREVVRSAMLKVDRTCLENAIEQIKQTDNIRNHERYLISTLFNEANGRGSKENAETRSIDFAIKRDFGF